MRNGIEVVQKVKAAGPDNLVSYYFWAIIVIFFIFIQNFLIIPTVIESEGILLVWVAARIDRT